MNRLDHPHYFTKDFACPDLVDFFASAATTNKGIWENRKLINHFFDRLIVFSCNAGEKYLEKECDKRVFYLKMKWVIFLHHLMQETYHDR